MKTKLYTHIWDYGQYVDALEISLPEQSVVDANEVKVELDNHFHDLSGKEVSQGAIEVKAEKNVIHISFDPFLYRYDFEIHITGLAKDCTLTKEDIEEVVVAGLEEFAPEEEEGVRYRLYTPACSKKRPLVLFLHGGGESGEDNLLQMTGTIGALELAKRFPEMYVMAPQAPGGGITMEEHFAILKKRGNPFRVEMGALPMAMKGERGWNRDYLGRVIDIIRRMIEEGKVDERRVYVTGMSMGGAGTIQAVSIAPDLFAAAAPICPSMNGETYTHLLQWPKVPIWVTTAYMDHQHGRHAYILNALNKLWDEGRNRNDYRYTIYLPEEMEAYGIGTTPEITDKELDAENHNSWILTLHNEKGVLSWLFSNVKEA